MFYFLANWDFVNTANGAEGGTRMPRADWNYLKDTKWIFPNEVSDQQYIASIFTTIDNVINLLSKQNKVIEELAAQLFLKSLHNSKNQENKKLGDIAIVQNGFAFKSSDYIDYSPDHLEVLKMGHIKPGGGLRDDPKKSYIPRSDRLQKWILSKGDIVMAMTDMKDNVVILGVPALIDVGNKYVLNQRVARIYLKSDNLLMSNYLLYLQLKDKKFISELQSRSNSGVQVNLSTEEIKNSDIVIPSKQLQASLTPIIASLYEKFGLNNDQMNVLKTLRDKLLPKIMNNKVQLN